jgi:hypothetical protein
VPGVSGLGLVQVYTLISPGRSGRCLRSCTNRRNLVAPLAGYELKRPYICRLAMGGLKTRELESYKPGLTTSTDSDSHLFNEVLCGAGPVGKVSDNKERVWFARGCSNPGGPS